MNAGWGKPLVAVCVSLLAIGFAVRRFLPAGSDDTAPSKRSLSVKIDRVVSGNRSKTSDDEELMFAGIRAPYRNEPLGEESYRLTRMLIEAKRVRLRFGDEERDKNGRWVAYVFIDGEMVNKRMVAEGLAYVRLKPTQQRFADELLEAQRAARKARAGLWRLSSPEPAELYPGDRKHGTFHRPGCEDVSNTRPGNQVFFGSRDEGFDAGFAPCGRCGA